MDKIKTASMAGLVTLGLLLAGCSTSEPGKDFGGNAVKTDSGQTNKASNEPAEDKGQEEEPKGPKAFPIGGTATITQGDKDAAVIALGKPAVKAKDPSMFGDKSKNGHFLIFPITVRAIGTDTFDINPFDFYVRDAQGNKFDYGDGTLYMDDRGINATTLNPKEQVKGIIVFDAGKAAHEIVYAPLGQALGFWKF